MLILKFNENILFLKALTPLQAV